MLQKKKNKRTLRQVDMVTVLKGDEIEKITEEDSQFAQDGSESRLIGWEFKRWKSLRCGKRKW